MTMDDTHEHRIEAQRELHRVENFDEDWKKDTKHGVSFHYNDVT